LAYTPKHIDEVHQIAVSNTRALKKKVRKNIIHEIHKEAIQQIISQDNSVRGRLQRKLFEKGLKSEGKKALIEGVTVPQFVNKFAPKKQQKVLNAYKHKNK